MSASRRARASRLTLRPSSVSRSTSPAFSAVTRSSIVDFGRDRSRQHSTIRWRITAMNINKAGTVPTRRAPAEYFTGTVLQDPVEQEPAPARLAVARDRCVRVGPKGCDAHTVAEPLYLPYVMHRVQREERAA